MSSPMEASHRSGVQRRSSSGGAIPLFSRGGGTGLLRGTDRSLTVAAPFILAKAHGRSLAFAAPTRTWQGRAGAEN